MKYKHFVTVFTLLEYFCFYFHSIVAHISVRSTPDIFKTVLMHFRGLLLLLLLSLLLLWISAYHTWQTYQDRNGEKRRVSVWYLQRPCCPPPGVSYFLDLFLCSGRFTDPKCRHLMSWE